MNYYTSDLHLNSEAVLLSSKRPFKSVEEMNETIIKNINDRVREEDILYILGDVATPDNVVSLLRKIKCQKILIVGNWDKRQLSHRTFCNCFKEIHTELLVNDGEYDLFLGHYPHAEWLNGMDFTRVVIIFTDMSIIKRMVAQHLLICFQWQSM